jgi:hypothetical protein
LGLAQEGLQPVPGHDIGEDIITLEHGVNALRAVVRRARRRNSGGAVMSALGRSKPNLVGSVLAEARRNVGMTQSEVGRRVGRPQKWVSDVEDGHAYCRFDDFIAISTALGADPPTLCERYLELQTLREGVARVNWRLANEQ